MSSQIYECRWADCRREFGHVDLFKEHIDTHIEENPARLVSELPSYRRAAALGPSSSAPQPELNYLNTQGSVLTTMSPPDQFQGKSTTRKSFSALGLGGEASPSIPSLMPSPSMSTKIRDITSPKRGQMRDKWASMSPMSGLATQRSVATTSEDLFTPRIPRSPVTLIKEGAPDLEVTKTPVPARSQSSDDEHTTDNPRKRKQGVMFTEPTTPANKKKKKNPKTPFPDPDLDSSEEEEEEEGVLGGNDDTGGDPYMIATQAPAGSSWDGLSTPEFEDDLDGPSNLFLQALDGTGDAPVVEEIEEEREVASQLGDAPKTSI
ncbi:hypothetical protein M408DRAFT_21550 [Serendipita vermifera MAFF 305830]|uniref:C2H2-type domain-containing protein n=1 Tax=Serendipita vermifera MAFF 305830 TaxID=933852 RepID=A0A0C2XRI6_SERVB|nr:hypothetical protein M408DRAFT_21550 [Serendipita vermifera MAFF 305830]